MTGAELANILVAAATLVTAVAGLVVAFRTGQKAAATHDLVNGQSKSLLDLTGRANRAEGVQAGIDQERDTHPS